MKKGYWLPIVLASTALAVVPVAAQAQDASGQAPSNADIDALRQQVQALQQRLDQMQAQEQAAVAAAAATPAPAPSPSVALPGWLNGTSISGKAYLNFSSIHQISDGKTGSAGGAQADLKRFYLSVDHKFSDIFSADLTTDVRYGSNGLTNDDVLYVKKAYLQAKLSPAFWVRLGAADLPWIPFAEGVYNYRFVENTLIDRTKYGTSSDYGVHVGGDLANGLISYQVSAIDGHGYKTLVRSSDTLDLEGRLSIQPLHKFVLAVGGYTGKLGKSVAGSPDTPHTATRFDALAAYTGKRARIGVEYFTAKNWNNVATTTSDKSDGWSAFGSFNFTPKLALFGRYDWVNPNQYTDPSAKEHYYNIGVDYIVVKNIDVAAVYKRDSADNIAMATSNGTIGGVNYGTYDEFGIFTQLKF